MKSLIKKFDGTVHHRPEHKRSMSDVVHPVTTALPAANSHTNFCVANTTEEHLNSSNSNTRKLSSPPPASVLSSWSSQQQAKTTTVSPAPTSETKSSSSSTLSKASKHLSTPLQNMSSKAKTPAASPKPSLNAASGLVTFEEVVKVGSAKDLFKNPDDKPTGEAALREGYKRRIAGLEADNERFKQKKATLQALVEVLRKEQEELHAKLEEAENELKQVAHSSMSSESKPKVVLRIPGAPDVSVTEMMRQRRLQRVLSSPGGGDLFDHNESAPTSPVGTHTAAEDETLSKPRSMSARPSVMGALGKVRHQVGDFDE